MNSISASAVSSLEVLVQHGDIVVVRGRGEYEKGIDLFSVKANGIFVRPRSEDD